MEHALKPASRVLLPLYLGPRPVHNGLLKQRLRRLYGAPLQKTNKQESFVSGSESFQAGCQQKQLVSQMGFRSFSAEARPAASA